MVGRSLGAIYPERNRPGDAAVFRAENLTDRPAFASVSFEIHTGEILGFFGLIGSGRTEVARAIFGGRFDGGKMELDGKAFAPRQSKGGDPLRPGVCHRGA